MALITLEMAFRCRDQAGTPVSEGLVNHNDTGSKDGFNRLSQHLDSGGSDGQARRLGEGVDGQVVDEFTSRTSLRRDTDKPAQEAGGL